jgi:hypothetical protein
MGPGAAHSERMLALARRHIVMVLGSPDSYQSSIHMTMPPARAAASRELPVRGLALLSARTAVFAASRLQAQGGLSCARALPVRSLATCVTGAGSAA